MDARSASVFIMDKREEEIAEMINYLSQKSKGFTKPKLIVIGGYALRAFVPFSRYSRDCDFVLKEGLDKINKWPPSGVSVETIEKKEGHAYMRWIKILQAGNKKAKLGIDFMEGQVRGRENDIFTIDDKFLENSSKVKIKVGVLPHIQRLQDQGFLKKPVELNAAQVIFDPEKSKQPS